MRQVSKNPARVTCWNYVPVGKKNQYTLEQLNEIKKNLDLELHPGEFSNSVKMSNRQIKIIRQIFKKGKEHHIKAMYECKYTLISILNIVNMDREIMKGCLD